MLLTIIQMFFLFSLLLRGTKSFHIYLIMSIKTKQVSGRISVSFKVYSSQSRKSTTSKTSISQLLTKCMVTNIAQTNKSTVGGYLPLTLSQTEHGTQKSAQTKYTHTELDPTCLLRMELHWHLHISLKASTLPNFFPPHLSLCLYLLKTHV